MNIKNVLSLAAATMLAVSVSYSEKKSGDAVTRNGNIETVEHSEKGKVTYRLVYTYDGDKVVRGEYWESLGGKKKEEVKPNKLAGTELAKKYEAKLANANIKDDSGIVLDEEKNGFVLKAVRTARYNAAGNPEFVMVRGFSSYPVVGSIVKKSDYTYSYDANGRLSKISEKNINVDTLLVNMGMGNETEIIRDESGRPLKVTKKIDAVPPVSETTEYTYSGTTDDMAKTVYRKCETSMTSFKTEPSETITTVYEKKVPWSGKKKYKFEMGKTIDSFLIYDEKEKKNKLKVSGFKKMSIIEKGMLAKQLYDVYSNEKKGPTWRMGDLADVPEPFLIYNGNGWWE